MLCKHKRRVWNARISCLQMACRGLSTFLGTICSFAWLPYGNTVVLCAMWNTIPLSAMWNTAGWHLMKCMYYHSETGREKLIVTFTHATKMQSSCTVSEVARTHRLQVKCKYCSLNSDEMYTATLHLSRPKCWDFALSHYHGLYNDWMHLPLFQARRLLRAHAIIIEAVAIPWTTRPWRIP